MKLIAQLLEIIIELIVTNQSIINFKAFILSDSKTKIKDQLWLCIAHFIKLKIINFKIK